MRVEKPATNRDRATGILFLWHVLASQTQTWALDGRLSRPRAVGCCLVNARSVCNKATLIHDLILEEKADLACITETWMGQEGGVPFTDICPASFQVWHQLRPQEWGRGQPPCYMATSLPELLDSVAGLAVEFHKPIVLGDFNLPSLGAESLAALGVYGHHGSHGPGPSHPGPNS